ncbi:pentapeptide repeat-containing protein [Nitrosospira sp. Nsp14]|uniref:pentapeptide repeat-containing protein n=1 Tax=Nitrosospira sp. Nsp14 TaxID=1855333 RepID=UPI0015A5FA64|nr:pentapeptide repeat-containing protein [Nitrosospira sp. Nsp14]
MGEKTKVDKSESYGLFGKGRDEWNNWAQRCLSDRAELEAKEEWRLNSDQDGIPVGANQATIDWLSCASADFSNHSFGSNADLSGFIFPGPVIFREVAFHRNANFELALFHHFASFESVTFSGPAHFQRTVFAGGSSFRRALFQEDAHFTHSQFLQHVNFEDAQFSGGQSFFDQARIKGTFQNASFGMVTFDSSILSCRFNSVTFGGVSDFSQTLFEDATSFLRARFVQAIFAGAEFKQLSWFIGAVFEYNASFFNTRFHQAVAFQHSKFESGASFTGSQIADAEFFDCKFGDRSDFTHIQCGLISFERTKFASDVAFHGSSFKKDAKFRDALFSGDASFAKARFEQDVVFNSALFKRLVEFDDVKFGGMSNFSQATFDGSTSFNKATFCRDVAFVGIRAQSLFALSQVTFHLPPDFRQAHFSEAPSFDESQFCVSVSREPTIEFPARWRALKRLAIQAHDHERELEFFAQEIKSLRNVEDFQFPIWNNYSRGKPLWPGGVRYWMGLLYEQTSDFGRSVLGPLVGLVLLMIACTCFYFSYQFNIEGIQQDRGGSCTQIFAAMFLAVHNGLVVTGLGRSNKLEQSYSCLYGGTPSMPNMPDVIVLVGIFQTLLSAVLIFLLLLAIRNKFRIK